MTNLKEVPTLDRGKRNWQAWSTSMANLLDASHLGGYLSGLIPRPDATIEPRAALNWDMNNVAVVGAMKLRATIEEQKVLAGVINARKAWVTLRDRHVKVGPIAQILMIQEAFDTVYTKAERFADTSARLEDLVQRIYVIGIPTEDVFLSITMLHALSGDLSNVRDHVANLLTASTAAHPFTSSDIRLRLDTEQQI
ncbi:hypothetical protein BV22DRAFT_1025252, partial [Leucogyrophana mollusca]